MVRTTLFCLPRVLNACSRRVLHPYFRHRSVLGCFHPHSYYPSRGYPLGTGSLVILPSMAPRSRRVRRLSASSSQ